MAIRLSTELPSDLLTAKKRFKTVEKPTTYRVIHTINRV